MSPGRVIAEQASDAAALRLGDRIEAAAFHELYAAAPIELAGQLGIATRQIAGATLLLAPGIPDPFFNRVIGLGMEEAAGEAALDEIIGVFRAAGVNHWWLHLTPPATPVALRQWLSDRGFTTPPRRSWAKMLYDTAAAPHAASSLEIRRARASEAIAVAEAICAAFGMPPAWAPWFAAVDALPRWQCYAAVDAGRIVGGGLLYIDGRDAWLGAGGVLPEARRRHAHRALMALRVADAITAGCRRIVTETGEPIADEPNPSLANMVACGFRHVGSRLNFVAPAA